MMNITDNSWPNDDYYPAPNFGWRATNDHFSKQCEFQAAFGLRRTAGLTSAYPRRQTAAMEAEGTSVQVAVRVRPLIGRERVEGCDVCTSIPNPGTPQLMIG